MPLPDDPHYTARLVIEYEIEGDDLTQVAERLFHLRLHLRKRREGRETISSLFSERRTSKSGHPAY